MANFKGWARKKLFGIGWQSFWGMGQHGMVKKLCHGVTKMFLEVGVAIFWG